MAKQISAINAYCPRIQNGQTIKREQLAKYIADRTGLNLGDVLHMFYEIQDAVVFFANNGQGVQLEGVLTMSPSIALDGKIKMKTRISNDIIKRMNVQGAFKGSILNKENIGKTSDELIVMWNEANPSDPIT